MVGNLHTEVKFDDLPEESRDFDVAELDGISIENDVAVSTVETYHDLKPSLNPKAEDGGAALEEFMAGEVVVDPDAVCSDDSADADSGDGSSGEDEVIVADFESNDTQSLRSVGVCSSSTLAYLGREGEHPTPGTPMFGGPCQGPP